MIESCSGQLRSAGMGGVTGFDMPAFLEAARVEGCDVEAMMILLPYGEMGLLEAMNEERDKS